MTYNVSKELMQAILNYLASRPYNEVHQLVAEMLKVKPNEGPRAVEVDSAV